ncbi:TMV resistance protein N, partial [Mucuna pruriens]
MIRKFPVFPYSFAIQRSLIVWWLDTQTAFALVSVQFMASSSSSCDVTKIKHDVFISFRGTDVRKGLLSHLQKELRRRQIDTYVDEKLDKGGEISPLLLRAIEGSQISLVIFSKDYASSRWCLEELAKIIECMERDQQTVLPVFFNVDPSDVRHQLGNYGDALAKHEETLKVQSWRSALENAANLSGFHYPTNFVDEFDLVQRIVEDISKKLSKFYPSESNGLLGIDQTIAQIKSLLKMESSEVLLVGIWGMGGIGKTTLARAIYEIYYPQYEGCCFLNVREKLEKHELSLLRDKIIFELLEEGPHTSGISKARFLNSAVRRMSRKKVLLVLEDVNTSEQLKYLVGEPICFGAGSRVIVTSRDKHVLTSGGVKQIHQVRKMDPRDSLKLFCLNAFNESHPKKGYEKLSKEVVKISQGNPLALKVLGSDFHSRSIDTWECALRKIKKHPNKEIQSVLRYSYDGLDEVDKKAFLDIAFFFQEDDKDYVIEQLDAWGFYGKSGIEVLQRKALITISENRIQMHNLIREMGWEIVRQEYPARRSRLRDFEEVYDVLRSNVGNDTVEGMQIDASRIKGVSFKNALKKMPRLRFLKFYLPMRRHAGLSAPAIDDSFLSQVRALVLSAGEIHIKYVYYHLIDGCSVDLSRLNSLKNLTSEEMSMMYKIEIPGMQKHSEVEMMGNSFFVHLSDLDIEYSDVDDVEPFKNLPNELLCLKSMHYVKYSKREQDTEKRKLHIQFDGIRCAKRISYKPKLHNSVIQLSRAEILLLLEEAIME